MNLFLLKQDGGRSYGSYPLSFTNENDCIYSKKIQPNEFWKTFLEDNENYYYGSLLQSVSNYTIMHEIGHNFGLAHAHEGCGECMPKHVQQYSDQKKYVYNERVFGFAECGGQNRYVIHDHAMDYYSRIEGFTYDQVKIMRQNLTYRPWIKNLMYSDR